MWGAARQLLAHSAADCALTRTKHNPNRHPQTQEQVLPTGVTGPAVEEETAGPSCVWAGGQPCTLARKSQRKHRDGHGANRGAQLAYRAAWCERGTGQSSDTRPFLAHGSLDVPPKSPCLCVVHIPSKTAWLMGTQSHSRDSRHCLEGSQSCGGQETKGESVFMGNIYNTMNHI